MRHCSRISKRRKAYHTLHCSGPHENKNNVATEKAAKELIDFQKQIQPSFLIQTTVQLLGRVDTPNTRGSGKPALASYTTSNLVLKSCKAPTIAIDNIVFLLSIKYILMGIYIYGQEMSSI